MDFGLSRQRASAGGAGGAKGGGSGGSSGSVVHGMATPGTALLEVGGADVSVNTHGAGTPSYAAPEQLDGGAVQAACDMFPLGLIA